MRLEILLGNMHLLIIKVANKKKNSTDWFVLFFFWKKKFLEQERVALRIELCGIAEKGWVSANE